MCASLSATATYVNQSRENKTSDTDLTDSQNRFSGIGLTWAAKWNKLRANPFNKSEEPIMYAYRSACRSALALLIIVQVGFAQQGYKKPPKEVLDILNAPVPPGISVSPK